jgi:hypothetical protein
MVCGISKVLVNFYVFPNAMQIKYIYKFSFSRSRISYSWYILKMGTKDDTSIILEQFGGM